MIGKCIVDSKDLGTSHSFTHSLATLSWKTKSRDNSPSSSNPIWGLFCSYSLEIQNPKKLHLYCPSASFIYLTRWDLKTLREVISYPILTTFPVSVTSKFELWRLVCRTTRVVYITTIYNYNFFFLERDWYQWDTIKVRKTL